MGTYLEVCTRVFATRECYHVSRRNILLLHKLLLIVGADFDFAWIVDFHLGDTVDLHWCGEQPVYTDISTLNNG